MTVETVSTGRLPYTYNAENEITSANGVTYTYDGNRMRVEKTGGTLYWRDVSGNAIAETNLSGATQNIYIFFAGRRLAQRSNSSGNYYYYQVDQTGTTKSITQVTSAGAASICYDADFTPYGSEMTHTNSCTWAPHYKFTGYERDTETGLDYGFNRYYNPRLGRFMSADPLGVGSANYTNPQSMNRYAYVLNNPLSATDPRGLECIWDDGSYDASDDSQTGSVSGCQNQGGVWANLGQDGGYSLTGDNLLQDVYDAVDSGGAMAVLIFTTNNQVLDTMYNGQGQVTATIGGGAYSMYDTTGKMTDWGVDTGGQMAIEVGFEIANPSLSAGLDALAGCGKIDS